MLPRRNSIRPRRWVASLAVLLTAATLSMLPIAPARAEADRLVNTDVSYASGAHTLHGTVVAPPGQGRRPAVVLVAGAGATGRDDYRPEAEAFARAGIVTLIYDKRAGYSRATTSFTGLAEDAIAGVRLLRARADVVPARVGLWGHSQGGWVVPLAASMSPDVDFAITVSASGLRTDRTQLWSDRTYLRHAGVTPDLIDPIGVNLSRMLIAVGLFGDTSNDPVANLAAVRQPVLAMFGDHDRSTPPGESLTIFRQALDAAGNTHYTLRVIRDANHNMRDSTDGFSAAGRATPFARGYVDTITNWISQLGAATPMPGADPAPPQQLESQPTAPLAWYESPWLNLVAVLLMLVAFLAYPAGAVVRRLRGRRGDSPARWPARALAASGPVVVLGTIAFLFSVVASGATGVRGSIFGRPPAWLLLQLGAVAIVAATVATAARWRQAPRQSGSRGRLRLGVLVAGGLIFVPWAGYWGLFTL